MTDAPWRTGAPQEGWHQPTAPGPVWATVVRPPAPEPADAVPTEPWGESPPAAPRRHRTAVVVLSVLLAVALGAGAGLTWHLLRVNAAWQEHSQQWEALAKQHGADLAQSRSDLEATRTELAAVQDQLTNAQSRITQLADEKAKLGDQSAAQQQLADYQARISTAAGQVATALATCIDGQESLITYLEDSAKYDPTSLASYRANVQNYCGQARDANATLQAELAK